MAVHAVPRLAEAPSYEEFAERYLRAAQPVLMPAQACAARAWTLASLRASIGSTVVHTRTNTACEDYKLGKAYNITQMTVNEYIDNLEQETPKSKNCYLAVQNIKQAFPQLASDMPVPAQVGKLHGGPFLWLAPRGHYEYCHMDADDNFLLVFQGRKVVRIFPAAHVAALYPNALGSLGRTIQSQVDIDHPDLSKYPAFAHVPRWECTVEPGDMLFIPAFYWHQVTSPEITISVNIFFGPAGENNFIVNLLEGPQREAFLYWLMNILEQNRHTARFVRVLGDLRRTLAAFMMKQWHERPTESQLDTIIALLAERCAFPLTPPPVAAGHADSDDEQGEADGAKDTSSAGAQPAPRPRNPPKLPIRGLLWRSANE